VNSQPNPFAPPASPSPDEIARLPPQRPIAGFLWSMARIVAWAVEGLALLGVVFALAVRLHRADLVILRGEVVVLVLMICSVIVGMDIERRRKA
jgi:hypothetical protein